MKEAWESLGGAIGDTGHNLMEFLTEDKTGVEKFIDTLKKLDNGYIQVGEDGQNIINIDNMKDLADKMGTDVSFVQVLLDKLSEYGWDIHVNSDELDLASTKAEEANERLKELGATDYTFNFNADSDSIDKEIKKAKDLINNPMFKDANGNFDINIDGAAEAQQILVNLIARKEELTNHPIIMDIDSSKLEGKNKLVIDDLKNLQSYISEYNIKIDPDVNMDTTEVKKQIGDTLDEIDKLPNDIQEKLGLSNEKVKAAAQLLKQNIADGVTLDSDALSTIQQAISSIDPEILASLGINMDDVQKEADATAQAFESALTSVLDNLVITVNGKKIEFTVGADTTQVDEATKEVQEAKAEATSGWDLVMNAENKEVLDASEESKQAMTDLANGDYTAWARLNNTDLKNNLYASQLLLDDFDGKTATAYINVVKKTTDVGVGMLMNSIKANGTFHGFAEGTFLRGYSSGTDVAIQKDQKAVINEVGTEAVLRNGVLTEIPGGAQLIDLKRGDIVFNNLQLKQLKQNGYVTANGGHGKLIGGFAYGTLNGISGYNGLGKYKVEGEGSLTGSNVAYAGANAVKNASKSSSKNSTKSSSKSSSGSGTKSNSSSSSTDSSSDAEKTEETLDWIETKISRVERLISNLGKTVSATYKSWSERNNALSSELSQVNSEISIQQQAYNRYMQEANKVGLDAGYAQKVRDGKIDIETITDEDLKQKIEDYKNWYEKALDCSDAILDLKDDLYDLAQTNFDNITKQFEEQLDVIEHSVNMVEGYIDLAETRGYLASTDYYDSLIKTETQNIGTLKNEYDSLANTLNNMVNTGQIKKYSEAWYDLYGQITDVEEALQDATKALSEYESKMRELKWSYFEKQQDYITNFTDEMSWLVDLLEKQGKLVDDNGNMTNRGTATMGLHAVGYNTRMSQADDYAKEIQKINQQLAKDPFNTILIDKRQEYLKAQRDSIDAAYDEIDAAKSLMKEGYDAQIDALNKLIDLKKKNMDAEKSLYDYQKSVSEKVNNVSTYQKQVIAYQNDDSEEGRSKLQQAQKNLEDARTDLQETEWEQQISDVQNLLDTLSIDYEEFLNQRLDDLNFILNTMLDSANQNSESIKTTLTDATASVGTTLSETMNTVWTSSTGLNGIVTSYGTGFNNALTTTNKALASIEAMIKSMVQEAQKKAAEDAAKQAAAAKAAQAQTPKVNSTSNNNQNKSNNTSKSNGNFFIHKIDGFNKNRLNKENSIVDFR